MKELLHDEEIKGKTGLSLDIGNLKTIDIFDVIKEREEYELSLKRQTQAQPSDAKKDQQQQQKKAKDKDPDYKRMSNSIKDKIKSEKKEEKRKSGIFANLFNKCESDKKQGDSREESKSAVNINENKLSGRTTSMRDNQR